MFLIIHSITLAEKKKYEQCWIDRSNLFSSFLFILEKKRNTQKKRNIEKEKKTKQTNTRAQRKHGQHIQNQGPKQTTRNAHAADKNVCE